MSRIFYKFLLSTAELEYLRDLVSDNNVLLDLLTGAGNGGGRKLPVQLTRDQAEEFKDRLTMRLATVGFDKNDEPNAEGRFIEDLIDKLFIR